MRRERIFDLGLVAIVTFLTCWLFWESIIKNHIEQYIKDNYGYAIMETNESINTIKEILVNDKNGG